MKQGQWIVTLVMSILAAAVAIYIGAYVFNTFNDPYTTTTAYAYTAVESVKADGLLVREETVIPGQGGIADIVRGEGEKVGTGQTVALEYQNVEAQAAQAELESLEEEIELLEAAATGAGSADTAASLDENILESVVALRSEITRGDCSSLQDRVMDIKSGIIRRSYTYGEGLSAGSLAARVGELRSRYEALNQQTEASVSHIMAPVSGVFSGCVDGYESTLNPDMVMTLTPSTLPAAMEQHAVPAGTEIGKLVTDPRWFFVSTFDTETASRLTEGETVTMRFTGDFTQDVDMKVAAISAEEGGKQTVVFSSDWYMSRTTLLRRQTAELIFDSWSGIRIPKSALRTRTYTREPEPGSSASASGGSSADSSQELVTEEMYGVYAVVAGRLEFKEAEVVIDRDEFYVVKPASTGSRALRAGDRIIVRGTGLYDGMLLEY